MTTDHHDSLVVAELLKLSQDERDRFRRTLRAHSDLAEEIPVDLTDLYLDFATLAVRARYLDGDPLWRVFGAVAESARLMQLCDDIEAATL